MQRKILPVKFLVVLAAMSLLVFGGCSQCSSDHSAGNSLPPPPPQTSPSEGASGAVPGGQPDAEQQYQDQDGEAGEGEPMDSDGADPPANPPGTPSSSTEGAPGAGTDSH